MLRSLHPSRSTRTSADDWGPIRRARRKAPHPSHRCSNRRRHRPRRQLDCSARRQPFSSKRLQAILLRRHHRRRNRGRRLARPLRPRLRPCSVVVRAVLLLRRHHRRGRRLARPRRPRLRLCSGRSVAKNTANVVVRAVLRLPDRRVRRRSRILCDQSRHRLPQHHLRLRRNNGRCNRHLPLRRHRHHHRRNSARRRPPPGPPPKKPPPKPGEKPPDAPK